MPIIIKKKTGEVVKPEPVKPKASDFIDPGPEPVRDPKALWAVHSRMCPNCRTNQMLPCRTEKERSYCLNYMNRRSL